MPKRVTLGCLLIATCLALWGCGKQPAGGTEEGVKPMDFKMKSAAFEDGAAIPRKHTGDGPDVSPPLNWTEPPEGTKSLALICDDPDAPVGTWVHWVLYGMSAEMRELPEGVSSEPEVAGVGKQGRNDFKKIGYNGPAPPPGKAHRYFFKLYALDAEPELPPGATKAQLLEALEGHVLAEAQLIGRYQR